MKCFHIEFGQFLTYLCILMKCLARWSSSEFSKKTFCSTFNWSGSSFGFFSKDGIKDIFLF